MLPTVSGVVHGLGRRCLYVALDEGVAILLLSFIHNDLCIPSRRDECNLKIGDWGAWEMNK